MSYAATLVMHLNYGPKGSGYVRELTDFPGVLITDNYYKKKRTTERVIRYKEQIFLKIEDAIAAWKADHP